MAKLMCKHKRRVYANPASGKITHREDGSFCELPLFKKQHDGSYRRDTLKIGKRRLIWAPTDLGWGLTPVAQTPAEELVTEVFAPSETGADAPIV